MAPFSELIQGCLAESERLLLENLTPYGIMAAAPTPEAEARNYTRIFGRDAAICALGMAVTGKPALIEGASAGLVTLAEHQADNGQIPKYVDPLCADSDFWYLGCIDATLWWLIAVHFIERRGVRLELQAPIIRALAWLRCQEHPRLLLLQQNEASDWADIMPRSGFVLYTNALWYHVKRLYDLPGAEQTKYHFNHLFYPFSREVPDYRRLRLLTHYVRKRANRSELYLSFVNFSFWGEEGDVFGNLLAMLFNLANDAPSNRIVHALEREQVAQPYPIKAVCSPIRPEAALWREYMGRHRQNLAWQYHNGGIWPFIGGFWVIALVRLGRVGPARAALAQLAEANARYGWEFNEWFHGCTGERGGMARQSWNAAMFLLAEHSLRAGYPFRL